MEQHLQEAAAGDEAPAGIQGRRRRVAVVGAGVIGAGWAAFFACKGLDVHVVDAHPGARARLDDALQRARRTLQALGGLAAEVREPVLGDDLDRAVSGADHIQEVLPEQLELKQRVYAQIEASAPDRCVIASSSSGIMPSALQAGMRHPERLVIAHPCNPPYLMPLVEICGGRETAGWAVEEAEAFYRGLGKRTVRLNREITGHLVNRLQAALWREAVYLAVNGYASVADVDRAVTEGLGARWAVCGPHEIFDLSGGELGMAGFLDKLGDAVEAWWASLGQPRLDAATRQALIDGMAQAAAGRGYPQRAQARDEGVMAQLLARPN
ncbi:3-hydroxyacyl-CoA dehydrogenase family protein [Castellaniella defragrans]|uniref:3-hydroxyacyl-CoA dehydrogenase family protein n=1 Tax=Castellaniella defragrans TaxID=75697 RepID=UPI0023F2B3C2|nr:3-hydroxyacyl-CoA dehydrogenase NAD-binding domain-containing protein [Castellaniella defragrans]